MKDMFKELFRFRWIISLLLLSVIGSVTANLALPFLLSDVINMAIPNQDMGQIVSISGTMLLFVLLGIIASIATGLFASVVSVGLGKNVRSKVFGKVQNFINMFLRVCIMAPIMCIGGIILALAKSRTMSMILLISMPVMIAFVLVIAKNRHSVVYKNADKIG